MKRILLIRALASSGCIATLTAQQPDPDAMKIGSVTVSAFIHERYEAWNWFPTKGESTYGFSGSLLRLGFSQQTANFDWNFELAAPILLGLPNRAVLPAPQGQLGLGGNYYAANKSNQNAAFVFPKQANVRLKNEHSGLQMGRFEFVDGTEVTLKDPTLATLIRDRIAHRLIGTFAFADVQRSVQPAPPWHRSVDQRTDFVVGVQPAVEVLVAVRQTAPDRLEGGLAPAVQRLPAFADKG